MLTSSARRAEFTSPAVMDRAKARGLIEGLAFIAILLLAVALAMAIRIYRFVPL